jgi:signal transduction histidine kinase
VGTPERANAEPSAPDAGRPSDLDPALLRAIVATSPFPVVVIEGRELRHANPAFGALARPESAWEISWPGGEQGPAEGRLEQLLANVASSDEARAGGGCGIRLRRHLDPTAYDVRLAPLPGHQAVAVWLLQAATGSAMAAAEAWIEQHERLRMTGEVALGIAHDMHNTLGAISLRVSVLKRSAEAMAAQGRNIDALERIVGEGNALVGKFQSLGRAPPAPSGSEIADLASVIAMAVEIAQSGLKMRAAETGVHIRMETTVPPLPAVTGTSEELCQLFVNLLINARDAMPKGGHVVISAEPDPPPDAVVVRVEDEGTGIPAAVLPRVFDSFFTTKGGSGTGMGLAMARATMTRIGGSIEAGNRSGGGAVFTLRFHRVSADSHGNTVHP